MSGALQQVETDDGLGTVDDQGRLQIELDDGSLIIRPDWRKASQGASKKHNANLALGMTDTALSVLAEDLLRGIRADDASRSEWLEGLAKAVEMLGIVLKKGGAAGDDAAAPVEGMSVFDHPCLLQACIRFQADFVSEMLPVDGPVKVRSDTTAPPAGAMDNQPASEFTEADLATAMEKDLNHYLTDTAKEYYPDTARMAFRIGLFGGGFKKVYDCPLRKRPVSESVQINDLIVDHSATDLENAALVGRVTHRIKMQNSMLRRMMKAKVYRTVELTQPTEKNDPLEQAELRAQGQSEFATQSDEHPHTIFECSTGLDPLDVGDGDDDGSYRPYKVAIEETSSTVLAVYRNWAEDDELRMPRREYVKFSYIDALGFYPLGLIHILGNTVKALTAAFRLFLDSGMFANFPGGLMADTAGKQTTNMIRVAPGSFAQIETGGRPIQEIAMPLPYKDIGAAFLQFIQHLEESGKSLGGEVSAPLQEGVANMPVGTMLASIEQAVKPLKGVFKGLHRSQAEEFQLLRDRFRENPSALWRYNKRPARQWEENEFRQALENADLVPMADPNTSSQVQRIALASAVEQLAEKAPMAHKIIEVLNYLYRVLGVPEGGQMFLKTQEEFDAAMAAQAQAQQKPGGAAQDPQVSAAKVQLLQAQTAKAQTEAQNTGADLQDKAADRQAKAASLVVESQDRTADRQSHMAIAQMKLEGERQKTGANMVTTAVEHHSDAQEAERQRQHELGMEAQSHQNDAMLASQSHQHEAGLAAQQRQHDASQTAWEHQHAATQAEQQAERSAADGAQQRQHEVKIAGLGAANKKGSK